MYEWHENSGDGCEQKSWKCRSINAVQQKWTEKRLRLAVTAWLACGWMQVAGTKVLPVSLSAGCWLLGGGGFFCTVAVHVKNAAPRHPACKNCLRIVDGWSSDLGNLQNSQKIGMFVIFSGQFCSRFSRFSRFPMALTKHCNQDSNRQTDGQSQTDRQAHGHGWKHDWIRAWTGTDRQHWKVMMIYGVQCDSHSLLLQTDAQGRTKNRAQCRKTYPNVART